MNNVVLMGRLTADPELRTTQNGTSCARFTIAVNRDFADKETGERQADFITCQAWRQTADFISKYFCKGAMICVEGRLQTGSYKDRNHEDVTHYTTDVIVNKAHFTGEKQQSSTQAAPQNYAQAYAAPQQQQAPQQYAGSPGYVMPTLQNQRQQRQQASENTLSEFEEILSDGPLPF